MITSNIKNNDNFFFFCNDDDDLIFYKEKMIERGLRGYHDIPLFSVGDILNVSYISGFVTYGFEGICICLRKKHIKNLNTSFILRNILSGVGVELTISFYYNRAYRFTIADYSRKDFYYKRAKLFYLRKRLNRASRIK